MASSLLQSRRREEGFTKQGEDERRKGETGGGDEEDRGGGGGDEDGAAGLSPESESERAPRPGVRVHSPGHERSRGTRGWEGVRAFTVLAPTRCTFPQRRSEGARFREGERKNMILERLAGTTAASDEEMRGFVNRMCRCARYSVQSLGDMIRSTVLFHGSEGETIRKLMVL